ADLRADDAVRRFGQRLAAAGAASGDRVAAGHRDAGPGPAAPGARDPRRRRQPMRFNLVIPVVLLVLLGLLGSVYVVREGQVALVLNLGRVARTDIGPGLHFKVPLI